MISDGLGPDDIFQCKKCGDCCKGFGGTFVTDADIHRIADYIEVDPTSFLGRYCQLSGAKPVLGQKQDGYCIFWDGICTIHPVKPHMCRAWPFIQSVMIDINNWHIMAGSCPGIRTDIPKPVIEKCVKMSIG